MKKSIVALLLALAVIVLVSPGIVGRLAEKSMDENLDWAATEAEEVVVSSQGFDRGWFSSAGRHRIEIRDGELRDLLLAYADADASAELPALIIETRIDHGLIPVTSMAREKGSLLPGLGSAVSTLGLETGDAVVPLPGKIYSTAGLTGELQSNFVLEPGSFEHDGATASWGDVDITVTTNPANGALGFEGTIASFNVRSVADDVRIEEISFSGDQEPTAFGFRVGPIRGSIGSISFGARPTGAMRGAGSAGVGPVSIDASSSVDGDRVSAETRLSIENAPFLDLGRGAMVVDLRIIEADGRALGNIKRGLERAPTDADPDTLLRRVEADARDLAAAGFELHLDEARITLEQGLIESAAHVAVGKTAADGFNWPEALLATNARADFSIDERLVQLAMAANPDVGGIIGMGFLKKNGDVYELHAEFSNGLLTVNGAPIPIP